MPGRGQRPGLGLAVSHDTGDDKPRVVERGAKGVRQCVAELAAFVNRAGRFGGDVAAYTAGNENCRNSRNMPSASRATLG